MRKRKVINLAIANKFPDQFFSILSHSKPNRYYLSPKASNVEKHPTDLAKIQRFDACTRLR